jgi:hypothetical protein
LLRKNPAFGFGFLAKMFNRKPGLCYPSTLGMFE